MAEEKTLEETVLYRTHRVLSLTAPMGTADYAKLEFGERAEYPRITVWLSQNKNKGSNASIVDNTIIAPFDFITLFWFLGKMKAVAKSETPAQCKIDCLNIKYVNGEKTKERYVQSTVTCFKDQAGRVFISVKDGANPNKPVIDFEISPKTFFNHYDEEGNEIKDKRLLCKQHAMTYFTMVEKIYTSTISDETMVDKRIAKKTNNPTVPPAKNESTQPSTYKTDNDVGLDELV